MIKKIPKLLLAFSACLIGLYPLIYFLVDRKFGLLQTKTDALLSDISWNTAFYVHIILGGVALLVGWTQFNAKWRNRYARLHRTVGKFYVFSVLISAIAGIYVAFFATGGIIPSVGFASLGLFWFATTLKAFFDIRKGHVQAHQKMMTYSYAACLAAVTLRIYLPVLIIIFQDFVKAYSLVAWLCWIPNIIAAYYINRRIQNKKSETAREVKYSVLRTDAAQQHS